MSNRRRLSPAILLATLLTIAPYLSAQHYLRTDLTQNAAGVSATASQTDPNLVTARGLSRASGSPWWISDNGTGLSTLYDAAGVAQSLVVTMAGKFEGTLLDASGAPIKIDGLWALSFDGSNTNSGNANSMYFTSGPMDEAPCIFGKLTAVAAEQRGNTE